MRRMVDGALRNALAVLLVFSLLAAWPASPHAHSLPKSHPHRRSHTGMVTVTFRLTVVGQIVPGQTFWVAYGPLDGHFGIFQLHQTSRGSYAASQQFPADGRTTW